MSKQIKIVVAIELAMLLGFGLYLGFFWGSLCSGGAEACFGTHPVFGPMMFLLVGALRPLILTPLVVVSALGGLAFGPLVTSLVGTLGATLATMLVYYPARWIGERWVRPWLAANLPDTWKLIQTQDYKVVFAARWIPLFPFDLMSIIFGLLGFRQKSVLWATAIGVAPEIYLVAMTTVHDPGGTAQTATVVGSLTALTLLSIVPLLAAEFINRRAGDSLLGRLRRAWGELTSEVVLRNSLIGEPTYTGTKPPVLLLYGFFSSRRAVETMTVMLSQRGYEVMSFNLGGLLGVFNTRNIIDVARSLDELVRSECATHNIKRIRVVAHSKGALVAMWWLTRLGGYRYCDTIITMGAPFRGSILTYLALPTPLSFWWRDLWQMRPNSEFLRSLSDAALPGGVELYCMVSEKDRVVRGLRGVYGPSAGKERVHTLWETEEHFSYLDSPHVADKIAGILEARPHPDVWAAGQPRHDGGTPAEGPPGLANEPPTPAA